MAFGFISYNIGNDKEVSKLLNNASAISADLTPLFQGLAAELRKSRKMIFALKSAGAYPDFKGDKIRKSWKTPGRPSRRTRDGNKTAYANFKIRHLGSAYPLLKLSGALESSLVDQNDSNHIEEITKTSLVFGTKLEYAKYHQQDEGGGKGIIPMRKFLFLGPDVSNQQNESGGFSRIVKTIEITILREMGFSLAQARQAVSGG